MKYGQLDKLLRSRNSWPTWLNSAIDAVADNPMGLWGRLASLRYWPRGKHPGVSVVNHKSFRVAIGPVNYSNQATLWAKSLTDHYLDVATSTFALDVPGGFNFPSDLVIPIDFYHKSRRWQRAQISALSTFSHVLVEAEEPLVGRLFQRSILKEKTFLEKQGVNVGYMAHGTDVRVPAEHVVRTPWSPYRDPTLYLARLNTLARRNVDFLTSVENPVFVSTPDLLLDVPTALWCPVVVDTSVWNSSLATKRVAGPLRVVHVPSVQTIKGTHLIEPVLAKLHAQGLIEYRELRGIPFDQMPSAISWADVVLDQFRLGSYGVSAVEAMAAHKVVIGHVIQEVRQIVVKLTGKELPVVEANPDNLESVLRYLISNPEAVKKIKAHGAAFVSDVHNGKISAEILMNNWIEPLSLTLKKG